MLESNKHNVMAEPDNATDDASTRMDHLLASSTTFRTKICTLELLCNKGNTVQKTLLGQNIISELVAGVVTTPSPIEALQHSFLDNTFPPDAPLSVMAQEYMNQNADLLRICLESSTETARRIENGKYDDGLSDILKTCALLLQKNIFCYVNNETVTGSAVDILIYYANESTSLISDNTVGIYVDETKSGFNPLFFKHKNKNLAINNGAARNVSKHHCVLYCWNPNGSRMEYPIPSSRAVSDVMSSIEAVINNKRVGADHFNIHSSIIGDMNPLMRIWYSKPTLQAVIIRCCWAESNSQYAESVGHQFPLDPKRFAVLSSSHPSGFFHSISYYLFGTPCLHALVKSIMLMAILEIAVFIMDFENNLRQLVYVPCQTAEEYIFTRINHIVRTEDFHPTAFELMVAGFICEREIYLLEGVGTSNGSRVTDTDAIGIAFSELDNDKPGPAFFQEADGKCRLILSLYTGNYVESEVEKLVRNRFHLVGDPMNFKQKLEKLTIGRGANFWNFLASHSDINRGGHGLLMQIKNAEDMVELESRLLSASYIEEIHVSSLVCRGAYSTKMESRSACPGIISEPPSGTHNFFGLSVSGVLEEIEKMLAGKVQPDGVVTHTFSLLSTETSSNIYNDPKTGYASYEHRVKGVRQCKGFFSELKHSNGGVFTLFQNIGQSDLIIVYTNRDVIRENIVRKLARIFTEQTANRIFHQGILATYPFLKDCKSDVQIVSIKSGSSFCVSPLTTYFIANGEPTDYFQHEIVGFVGLSQRIHGNSTIGDHDKSRPSSSTVSRGSSVLASPCATYTPSVGTPQEQRYMPDSDCSSDPKFSPHSDEVPLSHHLGATSIIPHLRELRPGEPLSGLHTTGQQLSDDVPMVPIVSGFTTVTTAAQRKYIHSGIDPHEMDDAADVNTSLDVAVDEGVDKYADEHTGGMVDYGSTALPIAPLTRDGRVRMDLAGAGIEHKAMDGQLATEADELHDGEEHGQPKLPSPPYHLIIKTRGSSSEKEQLSDADVAEEELKRGPHGYPTRSSQKVASKPHDTAKSTSMQIQKRSVQLQAAKRVVKESRPEPRLTARKSTGGAHKGQYKAPKRLPTSSEETVDVSVEDVTVSGNDDEQTVLDANNKRTPRSSHKRYDPHRLSHGEAREPKRLRAGAPSTSAPPKVVTEVGHPPINIFYCVLCFRSFKSIADRDQHKKTCSADGSIDDLIILDEADVYE